MTRFMGRESFLLRVRVQEPDAEACQAAGGISSTSSRRKSTVSQTLNICTTLSRKSQGPRPTEAVCLHFSLARKPGARVPCYPTAASSGGTDYSPRCKPGVASPPPDRRVPEERHIPPRLLRYRTRGSGRYPWSNSSTAERPPVTPCMFRLWIHPAPLPLEFPSSPVSVPRVGTRGCNPTTLWVPLPPKLDRARPPS